MKTQQLLDYTTPILKKNNTYGEFIEYQVFNYEKMKHVRYRIRLHKLRQQHAICQPKCSSIRSKIAALRSSWNLDWIR